MRLSVINLISGSRGKADPSPVAWLVHLERASEAFRVSELRRPLTSDLLSLSSSNSALKSSINLQILRRACYTPTLIALRRTNLALQLTFLRLGGQCPNNGTLEKGLPNRTCPRPACRRTYTLLQSISLAKLASLSLPIVNADI